MLSQHPRKMKLHGGCYSRLKTQDSKQFLSNTHALSAPAKHETGYNNGVRDRAKVGTDIGANELDI
jgi:hypothetical protein